MLGILNLYKPPGLTSRDCVNHLQKSLRGLKAGHAGTLDPIAEGVLLVAVDKGTRLIEYFQQLSKTYVGEFRLGCRSESLDTESPIEILEDPPEISREQVEALLPRFVGQITQVPPKFSAIKVNGKRAYQLARDGLEVEVPERQVTIHHLDLLRFQADRMELRVHCDGGTYIRTLGQDIARSCRSDAIMTSLRRTAIGPCRIEDALSLETLNSFESIETNLLNPAEVLVHMQQVTASGDSIQRARNGLYLERERLVSLSSDSDLKEQLPCLLVDERGQLKAVLTYRNSGKWGADRNFD